MAATTKKTAVQKTPGEIMVTVQKPPTRERPRPGAIMVELSPEDRAKLLAVQAAYTEDRGIPIAISWAIRLVIRAAWDRLTPDQSARLWVTPKEKKSAGGP